MYWNQSNEIHQETCWSTWWPETAPETSHQNREEEETELSQSEISLQDKAESWASTDAEEDQGRSSSEELGIEDPEKELKELKESMAKQEEMMQKIRSNAFQVAGYYLVFQGVIFTTITNSTSLQCRDAWLPFVLSLLSALLNFCTLFITWREYKKEHEQQQEDRKRYKKVQVLVINVRMTRSKEAFDSVMMRKKDAPGSRRTRPKTRKRERRPSPFLRWLGETNLFIYASVAIVICFVAITLFSCVWLLCRETDLEKQLYDDNKCVKLCGTVECIRVCPQ